MRHGRASPSKTGKHSDDPAILAFLARDEVLVSIPEMKHYRIIGWCEKRGLDHETSIMKPSIPFLFTCLLLLTVATLSFSGPAFARGGGVPNLLNSPGYQRALEESRKRYREQSLQSPSQTSAVAPRKRMKHRGHHGRHLRQISAGWPAAAAG